MSQILFVRHGPTEWNESRRIQGRTDVELSADGERLAASWRLKPPYADWHCFCSPLKRARQTANLLGFTSMTPVDLLQEMNWGHWEGHTLESLRRIDPQAFRRNEDRGLDFRPPGGESPQDVCRRLKTWFDTLSDQHLPAVAVCHKGVLRAALSIAIDWDMMDDPPEKLLDGCGHLYRLENQNLVLEKINIKLSSD